MLVYSSRRNVCRQNVCRRSVVDEMSVDELSWNHNLGRLLAAMSPAVKVAQARLYPTYYGLGQFLPCGILWREGYSFIHYKHLYSASSSGATQRRSQPQHDQIE